MVAWKSTLSQKVFLLLTIAAAGKIQMTKNKKKYLICYEVYEVLEKSCTFQSVNSIMRALQRDKWRIKSYKYLLGGKRTTNVKMTQEKIQTQH